MRLFLVVTELGCILVGEQKNQVVSKTIFTSDHVAEEFLKAISGSISEREVNWLKENVKPEDIICAQPQLVPGLIAAGFKVQEISTEEQKQLAEKKLDLLMLSGLASSIEDAERRIREISLEISNIQVREKSSNPDLQAIQSVQALDEIDKSANMMSSRVREWYGLHFPELTSMIDDNPSLLRLVLKFKTRNNFRATDLEQLGYSKNKSKAIETAAQESRGADLREEDISRIMQLAEEAQHLFSLRDKLALHVEKTMRQIAPNVTEIAGATIGARLLAKAGGLDKLATLPASTIQILGAEKALYRALKSGSRPPKHGILFQHAEVHSAPKWQRGKIARSIAGKIAIAARVDKFRGIKDETVLRSLQSRLEDIKSKYKEAPIPVPRKERKFQRGGSHLTHPNESRDQAFVRSNYGASKERARRKAKRKKESRG